MAPKKNAKKGKRVDDEDFWLVPVRKVSGKQLTMHNIA